MGSSREIATGHQSHQSDSILLFAQQMLFILSSILTVKRVLGCAPLDDNHGKELHSAARMAKARRNPNPKRPQTWQVVLRSFLMQDLLFHLLCRRLRLGIVVSIHACQLCFLLTHRPKVCVTGTLQAIAPCINLRAEILIIVSLITQYLVYSGFKEATDSPTV